VTPAERDRMNLLSMLIQCERDHKKYLQYVKEINEIMRQKEKRLEEAETTHQNRQSLPQSDSQCRQ
jgi:hypothetical protein